MTGPEAFAALLEHRISLDKGTRITSPGHERPIWIARKNGITASDESATEAVAKVLVELGRGR
jgi:hypothetical protein